MKAFSNYDEAKKQAQASGSEKLPAGAYVCKILGVKFEVGENGNSDRIAIQFDIEEGENKGFFKKQYEASTSDDKKWKGATRIYVPNDNGSEQDSWTKKSFAGWTNAFELSNPGYTWDWDENKWKGLKVGIVFGETGTKINGKDVVYTEARFAIEVEKVRDGSAPAAKFKSKNGYGENSTSSDGFMTVPSGSEDEIPF